MHLYECFLTVVWGSADDQWTIARNARCWLFTSAIVLLFMGGPMLALCDVIEGKHRLWKCLLRSLRSARTGFLPSPVLLIPAAQSSSCSKKVQSVFSYCRGCIRSMWCDVGDAKRRRLAKSRSCWDEPACTGGRARWGFVIKRRLHHLLNVNVCRDERVAWLK